MAGLGMTAGGISPFGVGAPDGAFAPPDTRPTASRFVNWRTKDYEVAENGEVKRMPTVRHRVLMALGMTKGSSSVLPEDGLQLPDRIDNRYAQLAEQRIRAALSSLVKAKELRINFVRITRTEITGRVDHLVSYTDLTTGNAETVTI
jgi:phage baseplate assembly protein W